jgi:hypothetical protein
VNIDEDLANRIFLNIGEEILSQGDRTQDTLKWRVLKQYYLSAMLTELAANPWIGARTRKLLVKEAASYANYSPYQFVYKLPIDCARPLEIQGNYFYVVEDNRLLTDRDNAALLYITNGKRATPIAGDDYPDYDDLAIDPLFYDYLEKLLASKIAMKVANRPELHQQLFAEAALARQDAINTIAALSNSRQNGERRWDDYLVNANREALLRAAAGQTGGQ